MLAFPTVSLATRQRDSRRMPSSPDDYRAWIGVVRDALIVGVGAFMLVFETVFAHAPNPYLIGAGLTALGLPAAIRLDLGRKTKSEAE